MVVDDDDYDDDVWDDATEGWKGLKGWGSNWKWCMIHKIDYILTIVTDWVTDWLTKQNPEMLSHLKISHAFAEGFPRKKLSQMLKGSLKESIGL